MRTLVWGFTLALVVTVSGPAREARTQAAETPSALESSPDGWRDLLAGAGDGLKGWMIGKLPSSPKAKAEPAPSKPSGSQWKYDANAKALVCEGDGGHEWLRWDEELGDCVFHVEWRFIAVAGKKGYNSGIFVRNSADASIWHQAQAGDASGGFLFGDTLVDGQAKRVNLSRQLIDKRVKPAGEWNTCEVACKGKEISLWTNGATTCVFNACEVPRGYVGLEAEGWKIEFRNVKVKSLAAR